MSEFEASRNYVNGKVIFDSNPVEISGNVFISRTLSASAIIGGGGGGILGSIGGAIGGAIGLIGGPAGAAIGMGLAAAVNRLEKSEAESKVVILLTDGVNNAGYIKPMTAASLAQEYNVKVYTIGVGTRGDALAPTSRRDDGRYVFGMARVEIDERLLNEIATSTGGRYFRAIDEASLEEIYAEIDRLEKTEIEVTAFKRYSEEYAPWLSWGLIFLAGAFLLQWTLFRTLP